MNTTTDSSGNVVERYVYDPYGTVTVLNPDGSVKGDGTIASSGYAPAYLFQGGRVDPVTGLYHFGARDYSPTIGRWVQQDPTGYVDGVNLCQFADDRPTNELDPKGLDPAGFGPMGTNLLDIREFANFTQSYIETSKATGRPIDPIECEKAWEDANNPMKYLFGPVTLSLGVSYEATVGVGGSKSLTFNFDSEGGFSLTTQNSVRVGFNVGGSVNLGLSSGDVMDTIGAKGEGYDVSGGVGIVGGSLGLDNHFSPSGEGVSSSPGFINMSPREDLRLGPDAGFSVGKDFAPDVLWLSPSSNAMATASTSTPPTPTVASPLNYGEYLGTSNGAAQYLGDSTYPEGGF